MADRPGDAEVDLPDIDAEWDYSQPAATERRFRAILPRAREQGECSCVVELLTQIARAACLQRKYAEAHGVLDEAAQLLTEEMQRPRIRYLLERGRVLNDTLRTAEALECFQSAWSLAEQAEPLLAADALHMIAYVTQGEESIRWHRAAIEFCEKHSCERFRRWQTSLYMNVGDKYEELQDYESGLECVRSALAIAERLGWDERVVDAKTFLARLLRLRGDVESAVSQIQELLSAVEHPRGYVFEEYGECLLAQGQNDQSRAQFRRANELLSTDPWYPPTQTERLMRMKRMGGMDERPMANQAVRPGPLPEDESECAGICGTGAGT